jgi:hypothetical protein
MASCDVNMIYRAFELHARALLVKLTLYDLVMSA